MNRSVSLTYRVKAATVAALAGALVSTVVIGALYVRDPGVRLEMAGTHAPVVTGLFPPERAGQRTFAWSGETLRITMPGADRRVPWACEAMVINWRPPGAGPAHVRVASQQAELLATTVSAPEATLAFTLPPDAAAAGFDVTIHVTPTFQPGPDDPRHLGLAFDWVRCAPASERWAWPPLRLPARGAVSVAALGAAVGLAGVPAAAAAVLAAALPSSTAPLSRSASHPSLAGSRPC